MNDAAGTFPMDPARAPVIDTIVIGAGISGLAAAKAFADPGSIDEQFAFGLDCLISGFERLVDKT